MLQRGDSQVDRRHGGVVEIDGQKMAVGDLLNVLSDVNTLSQTKPEQLYVEAKMAFFEWLLEMGIIQGEEEYHRDFEVLFHKFISGNLSILDLFEEYTLMEIFELSQLHRAQIEENPEVSGLYDLCQTPILTFMLKQGTISNEMEYHSHGYSRLFRLLSTGGIRKRPHLNDMTCPANLVQPREIAYTTHCQASLALN